MNVMSAGFVPDDQDDDDSHTVDEAIPENVRDAVRTFLQCAGDDPDREGLRDTPARVVRA